MDNTGKKNYTIYLSKKGINHLDCMLQKTLICECIILPNINDELVIYESNKYACITHGKRRKYFITKIEIVTNKPHNSYKLLHLTEISSIN